MVKANGRSALGKVAAEQASFSATSDERKAFGLGGLVGQQRESEEPIYVVLKYYDHSHECFSAWSKDELSEFSSFVDKLRKQSWANIAAGARPKPCNPKLARNGARERLERVHNQLSKDIQFIELRVSKRARVHGFRLRDAFFLVLLDRDHRTFPE
jgi:hypothetical protein